MTNLPPTPKQQRRADLEAQLRDLDAAVAPHHRELAQTDTVLRTATLDSDPMELAAARERQRLLQAEIARLETARPDLEDQLDEARNAVSSETAWLSTERRIIAALTSPQGLAHPHLREMPMRDFPARVDLARKRLATVGEIVPPITMTL